MIARSKSRNNKTAIIGNGGAAAECIKALRDYGYMGEIHIFADNDHSIYNPMLSTYYVSNKIEFQNLFPYGSGNRFYGENQVTKHLNSPVIALDAEKRTVTNAAGYEMTFDQCLIATGASPVVPPIEGAASDKVFTMRSVDDASRLKAFLTRNLQKAIVVGASMVGIKLVETFFNLGMEICLVDMADHIFPMAAHPDCSKFIEERLRDKGIRLKFSSGLSRVEECDAGLTAYFDMEEQPESADLLLMCVGVRANTGFIDPLQIKMQQGVIVDDCLETNVKGIYAAGDVAQGTNLLTGQKEVIGLWANARYQGRTAGRNMAGANEMYPGNILHNITHFMGMDFVGMGNVKDYERTESKITNRDGKAGYVQLFWKNGELTGLNMVDQYLEAGALKYYLSKFRKPPQALAHSSPMIQNMLLDHYVSRKPRNQ